MISNFSLIPIRWLLPVDSEMVFCLLVRLLDFPFQEKFIAKPVNSTVYFIEKRWWSHDIGS